MVQNNSLLARWKLKNDIEYNWNIIADSFIPLQGELIIYNVDTDRNQFYPRIKIGDGTNVLSQLPFIDAGTINGRQLDEVQIYEHTLPNQGSATSIYVNKADGNIYYWNGTAYVPLLGVTYDVTTSTITVISAKSTGLPTNVSIESHAFVINVGYVTQVTTQDLSVVTGLAQTGGGNG